MREIETIREALTGLRDQAEAMTGLAVEIPAIGALATLETEINQARADNVVLKNALLTILMTPGYHAKLRRIAQEAIDNVRGDNSTGPAPRAALGAAIGRISK